MEGESQASRTPLASRRPESAAETAEAGDFDNDSVVNLLERALGTDPTDPNETDGADVLPRGEIPSEGSLAGLATLTFTIPDHPHSDLVYEVQRSDDLTTWSTMATKSGSGTWQAEASVVVEEGPEEASMRTVSVGGVTGTQPAHLRLTVKEKPRQSWTCATWSPIVSYLS